MHRLSWAFVFRDCPKGSFSRIYIVILFSALLKDKTGNWDASFYLTGVMLLIPALLILIEPLVIRCEKKMESEEDEVDAVPLRRQSSKTMPKPSQKDTDSLLDEDDIQFTSRRISQIYKPYRDDNSQRGSQKRTSAPLATEDDV